MRSIRSNGLADDMAEDKDELAAAMLRQREKARSRSAAYRAKRAEAGMVQIAVWVPKDRAAALKRQFDAHVRKITAAPPAK